MTREERETSLVEHLHRCGAPVRLQTHADLLLVLHHKFLVTPLVSAEASLVIVRLANCEKVRSQPAYRVLGHLGEEEGGEGTQGEEAKVPVQLDQDPRRPGTGNRLLSTKVSPLPAFCPASEQLHKDDDGDRADSPDDDGLGVWDSLLTVRVLQVLVVAEESSVEGVKGVGEHIDVGHRKDEDKKSKNLQRSLGHDIPAVGRPILVVCHLVPLKALAHHGYLKQAGFNTCRNRVVASFENT